MKIVLVDDDPTVLCMLSRLFQRKGHEVLTYNNPLLCPIYTSEHGSCFQAETCPDIIISDVDMPHVNGLTFIESVFKKGCHCRKLALISGQGLDSAELSMIAKFGARFFPKPLYIDEFDSWMMTD